MKKCSVGMLVDCNKIIRFKYRNEIFNKYFIWYNILCLFCLLGLFVCFVLFLVFLLLKKIEENIFGNYLFLLVLFILMYMYYFYLYLYKRYWMLNFYYIYLLVEYNCYI